jgi:hypothetical protein
MGLSPVAFISARAASAAPDVGHVRRELEDALKIVGLDHGGHPTSVSGRV